MRAKPLFGSDVTAKDVATGFTRSAASSTIAIRLSFTNRSRKDAILSAIEARELRIQQEP
jgi:hypothetical protein